MAVIVKGGTLPDTGVTKNEIYALVDNATLSGVINADIDANANIAGSKLGTLNTIAGGAGTIPIANIPAITTDKLPLTLTSATTGFTIAGGTTSKTLTVTGDATISGTISSNSLDSWVDKTSSYAAQQAATDGFVTVLAGANSNISGYTDANANPTTQRVQGGVGSNVVASFMMPVKKSDYWKVVLSSGSITSVYWIPLGS